MSIEQGGIARFFALFTDDDLVELDEFEDELVNLINDLRLEGIDIIEKMNCKIGVEVEGDKVAEVGVFREFHC